MGRRIFLIGKFIHFVPALYRAAVNIANKLMHQIQNQWDTYFAELPLDEAPIDQQLLQKPWVSKALQKTRVEVYRNGPAGAIWDMAAVAQPWRFRPEDIQIPVQVWHGSLDTVVPVAIGQAVATSLPNCEWILLEDQGHRFIIERFFDILDRLLTAPQQQMPGVATNPITTERPLPPNTDTEHDSPREFRQAA